MKKLLYLAAVAIAGIVCGCRSDYSESAVEKARTFALENLRGISATQMEFVKFTQPEIYENVIFPRYVTEQSKIGHIKMEDPKDFPIAPHQDLMHSCVVWSPPDLDAKIVVVGDGERNMLFWSPKRVLVKKFLPSDVAYTAAVNSCVAYAMSNMLYLSTAERNRIRFSEPAEIRFTKLPLIQPVDKKAGKSDWELYLMELEEPEKEKYQLSLMWKGDKEEDRIIFTGLTASGTLSGWRLETAEHMKASKYEKYLLTDAEIKGIRIAPTAEPVLVHPKAGKIDRGAEKASPDKPAARGSVIYH